MLAEQTWQLNLEIFRTGISGVFADDTHVIWVRFAFYHHRIDFDTKWKMTDSKAQLRSALQRNHRCAEELDRPGFNEAAFEMLQQFQRDRLAGTYSDLLEQQQFQPAARFFLDELYGGLGFRARDQQVAKVLPVMVRMLPENMQETLARALELQALSLELDTEMSRNLSSGPDDGLNESEYGDLYRRTGRFEDRALQIQLIHDLGMELTELVEHPLVLRLIGLLRVPARLAGFGKLQNFLESGLNAFRQMRDGRQFVEAIKVRELQVMNQLIAGAEHPFTLESGNQNASSDNE